MARSANLISPYYLVLAGCSMLTFLFLLIYASWLSSPPQNQFESATQIGFAAFTLLGFTLFGLIMQFATTFKSFSKISGNFFPTLELNAILDSRNFILGALTMAILSATGFSVLNFSVLAVGSNVFSTAANVLPEFYGYYLIHVASPIAEELLFYIGLPVLFIFLFNWVGQAIDFKPLTNIYVQLLAILAIVPTTFAAFHLGQQGVIEFFIIAMVFRTILTLGILDQVNDKLVPYVTTGIMFVIGGHFTINMLACVKTAMVNGAKVCIEPGGPIKFLQEMLSPFFSAGSVVSDVQIFGMVASLLILIVLGLILLTFFSTLFSKRWRLLVNRNN